MSIVCSPQKPNPSFDSLVNQNTNRDLGLSSVFNVNTNMVSCVEKFESPEYSMSGTCKPVTGLTVSDCYYNVSEIDDFDITFNFSGSTQYTGYTGQFCYSLLNNLPATPMPTNCTPYSGITGTTIIHNLNNISKTDNEYLLTTWNIFESKCDSGLTINTSNYSPRNTDGDYYFVTNINPPKPILEYIPFDVFEGINFRNEVIYPTVNGSNSFLLNSNPVGGTIVLLVNGVTVSTNDYIVDGVDSRLVTFVPSIKLESRDIVQAYYNTSPATEATLLTLDNRVKLEMFAVTGITSGVTSNFSATTYNNIINYNVTNNRLEMFLNEKIDPSVQPIVTINGVNLAYNIDVYKSNVVENKLVFNDNVTIETGDVISIYYYFSGFNRVGDLGELLTDTPSIRWQSQINALPRTLGSYGYFTVELAERNDPAFTNILKTGTTIYNNGISTYSLDIGPITTTSIKNYLYRVRFTKIYRTSVVTNDYTTESFSDSGSFNLNWGYINNTKF